MKRKTKMIGKKVERERERMGGIGGGVNGNGVFFLILCIFIYHRFRESIG